MEDTLRLIERTDRVLRDLEDEEVQRLNTALDNSYLELERELLRKYPNYTAESQPGLLATQRGVLLTQELSNVLSLVNPNREKEIQGRFDRLLQTSSKEGTTLSQELMRLRGGDDFVKATATIPIEAVAFEVRDAVERLKKHDQKFREDASIIISQGLIQGWGAKRVATQLRQLEGMTKGRAEVIARTEIISATDSAARANYKANGINYVQRIATQDSRVCVYCADRAGKVYPVDQAPAAIHPNDRCYNMPWMPEWEEQGRTNEDFIQRHTEDVRKRVEERGEKQRGDRAPFELAAGILAPKPVWSPADGWIDKDVERTAQNHALALLVLALLIAPKPQPPGLPPIIPIPIPIPKPPEEEDNQLLKTLLIGAAIVGVSVGAYYIARTRYRDGFKQSARMAVDMIPDIDLEDIGNNDQITFIAGGFAGQAGQSGLEYAPFFSQILDGHHLIGVPNPSTDKAPPIGTDPLKHITTNWGGLLNTAIVEGRNPDAVRMAAMAAAHYRKYGKPVNLIGYSAGGLVASEAHEILKVMGVPVKTATLGTPWFGFTDLSPDEMIGIMGKGDQFAGLPVQNRVEIEDVESHWLDKYFNSPNFQTELQNWFGISKPSDQSTEPRKPQRVRVDVVDETLVDLYPQLQLLSEDEIRLLPAPIAQKVLAARRANLMLTGKADPLLLTGLPELLALPEAVSQIVGLLEGKPDLKMLPGVKELLALPGVKDQIRGLLKGRPDPKLLPSAKELLALPAVAEVRGLLTGRLEPKMLRGIPEPPLLKGLEPFLMLPAAQDAIKGLLRGELPPLQLPAGIEVRFPQNEQALLLKQTTRQIYQQIRSTQRRFSREAERKIRSELKKIAAQNIPPMAKLQAYRQLMYEQLRAIAEPVTQQQAPGTKKPEDLVSFRFAGIEWHVPELKPTSPTLDTLRKLIELNLPDELVQAVDNVFISKQKGAYEEFWRKMLGLPIGPIPATVNFEDSSITAYRGRVKLEDMLRQMGYLLAERLWGRLEPPRNSEYWLAIANEVRPITTYGFNSTAADFADGVAQFFLDPQRLKRFNPRRYDAIARILNYRHPESVVPPGPPDIALSVLVGRGGVGALPPQQGFYPCTPS